MKTYYIDFESWNIKADSEAEAKTKALEKLKTEQPEIVNVEINED